jgi:hypothetical protein
MKGAEVIARFLESNLVEDDLVDAVYGGLYPVHFGARLKPHNCLTCIYAEPPVEATQTKTDLGACHNPIPRKYQAGLSYCSHSRVGEANGMTSGRDSADENLFERLLKDCDFVRSDVEASDFKGICKGGYSVIADEDLLERLKDCEFVRSEVEAYLDDVFAKDERTPIAPRPVVAARPRPFRESESDKTEPGHDQQVEDQEPTDAVPYIKWRRAKVGSIHDGQLMLEVQDRWGRPPKKTLDRAEIAAHVLGLDPPTVKTRESLENAFKNTTRTYKAMLKI